MSRKAFLIGASTLGLQYAELDVALMKAALERHQFDVTVAPKTKTELIRALDHFIDGVMKTDTLILYYSGHADTPTGSLRLILDGDLQKQSSQIPLSQLTGPLEQCVADNKLIILDCCKAGAVTSDWKLDQSEQYRILTASARLEKGKELDALKASFLTYHVHSGLTEHASEVANRDGTIWINALYEWLKERAKRHNAGPKAVPVPTPNLLGNQRADFPLGDVPASAMRQHGPSGLHERLQDGSRASTRVIGERVSTAVDVFRNHTKFCAWLQRLVLAREKPIISVTGRRGIGKSGLVAKVLSDFEEPTDSTDHQVDALAYFSTRTGGGVLDLARIFHGLADLLPQAQRDRLEEQRTNAGAADALPNLFAALRDRNVVLVLDNLDDLQDPESGRLTNNDLVAFLTAVCSHRHPPVVITTSQHPLGLPPSIGVHISRLEIGEGLELEEAVKLLRQYDADGDAGLRDLPDAELRQAVERVHMMPRGLELLVSLMKQRRTVTLQQIFGARDTPEVLLGQLVSAGFQSLDAVGRDVLRLLALAKTPLPVDALSGILDGKHPPAVVAQTVEQLVNQRMIGFDRATQRTSLHPLDSDYVGGTLLDDPPQQAALDLRLADWLATQPVDPLKWRTSTDVEPQLREIRHRLRAGDGHRAIQVIADIAGFLGGRGELDQLTAVLAQARSYADTPDTRAAYELSRGVVELVGGSLEEAVTACRTGRDAAEQIDDPLLMARLNVLYGNALRHMGDPAAAREPLAQASALPPTDPASRAIALQALFILGLVACYLNDVVEAADAASRCEAMLRPDDPAQWWAWLADLQALLALLKGDYIAALTEVERGILRYTDSPEQATSGYLANVRGLVLLAQGRTKEAAQEFVTVREDAVALRQVRLEGFAAINLAWTRLIEGDPIAAATMAREAADRLNANRVREAESAVALTTACEVRGVDARLALLRQAVRASRGNPDLYQPSDKTVANLAQAGNEVVYL